LIAGGYFRRLSNRAIFIHRIDSNELNGKARAERNEPYLGDLAALRRGRRGISRKKAGKFLI
jgi:hypothetical protein